MAQATGLENIGPQRTLLAFHWRGSVFCPTRITPENNEKIPPQLERQNDFVRASGGGNATAVEPSLGYAAVFKSMRSCIRA